MQNVEMWKKIESVKHEIKTVEDKINEWKSSKNVEADVCL